MSDDTQQLALPASTGTAQTGTMLTLQVAADRLGCSVATVRRLVRKGGLPGAELQPLDSGPQWVVPLAAVESELAARQRKAVQGPVTVKAAAPVEQLSAELVELRRQVAALQRQLDVEQALARERQTQLEQLHETFRVALMAGPQASTDQRRHWWQRSS